MRIKLSLACALLALVLPASASAVVGGRAVPSGGYPFVVAVGDARGPDCGGTLVAPAVVLTAAHCVAGAVADPAGLRVGFGSRAIGGGHVARVAAVYVHPGFSARALRYDAALLILAEPATGVPTVPMATSSPPAGSSASAAGWGRTREHGATSPGRLRSVALAIGTSAACARGDAALRRYSAPSMLCASKPGRDTCAGDSGGPLVATSHGRLELVGITSFGLGCARSGHPGLYTRVSAIRGWALAQVAASAAAAARLAALAGSGASPATAAAPA
jgi:secreted trypsin-like serine protease